MFKNTYAWKKVFSLVGILPLGAYVVLHFFTNNYSNYGTEIYDAKLEASRSWPFYQFFVIAFIYLPIAFHAFYGLFLAKKSRPNNVAWPYFSNLKYTLQRLSGIGLLLFIPAHIFKSKIAPWMHGTLANYQHMNEGLSEPLTFAIYCLGVLGVSFHLANGLWTASITWGICVSPRSQKAMQVASIIFFFFLAFLGLNAIRGLSDLI